MNIAVSEKKNVVPNKIISVMIIIVTEIMLFSGFISSYIISRANQMNWPPDGQERLPLEFTIVNTIILITSGVLLIIGRTKKESKKYFIASAVLGLSFFLLQGQEWYRLITFGLSADSSIYAAFFYLIIGSHAVHVLMGLAGLLYVIKKSPVDDETSLAIAVFWQFVVWLWPVLYYLIYLM